MTVTIEIPIDGKPHPEYNAWCYKNVFVPGSPKSWAIYNSYPSQDPGINYIVFRDEEDALAFRLKFGL